ncbi:MAG: sugar phosphate nucleotidyltransferase [Verrucomicrobiota bacterium]
MAENRKAFLLGAGLGTRLRPLTENLPKPLVPVMNRPLLSYAMDHLREELGVEAFLVNTHHCPEAYGEAFPNGEYSGASLEFRHEPVLLDTAGGIDNIRDWLPSDESFTIYNGDILTDLPLRAAWRHHCESENLVTLVLRSSGDELRVGFDASSGLVVDLRGALKPDWEDRYQFTGIYFVAPSFLRYIRRGVIESVVLSFLAAIEAGEKIGGYVADEGEWSDLGERDSYLGALRQLSSGAGKGGWERISPHADIGEGVDIDETSSVGAGAKIGAGSRIRESAIWSGARIEPGSSLFRVVVRSGRTAQGDLSNLDI